MFAQTPVFTDDDVSRSSVARLTKRLGAYLARIDTDGKRARALRSTLERYQFGMGLPVGPTAYTGKVAGAAGSEANVAYLRGALIEAWRTVALESLSFSEEAYVPALHKRKLVTVGTATQQRTEAEHREVRSADELRAAAEAAAARRPLPSRRRARESTLPKLSKELVGERVDVCFDIEYTDADGEEYEGLFWYRGTILRLGGREHGGGAKGTIIIEYDDGNIGSLLANRPTLWEVEEAGSWCIVSDDDEAEEEKGGEEKGSEEGEDEDKDEEKEKEEEEEEEDGEEEEEEEEEDGEMDVGA